MTINQRGRPVSLVRIAAVAGVRVRRVTRTRFALAALVLSLMPWLLVENSALVARLSSLAEFTLVGLTVIAAGALSDDIDSGEYAIALSHDCSPLDVLAGQAAASLGLTAVLFALQLPFAFAGIAVSHVGPLLLSFAWLAALLAGWLGVMLLLATFLDGKANAVAMVGLLAIVPLILRGTLLDRLNPTVAAMTRFVFQLLPQLDHVMAMFHALLDRVPSPTVAPLVLLVSPVLYFALASVRLYRLEPAGRLTQ